SFTCVRRGHEVLDHLRCDFVFRAPWQPTAEGTQEFAFREGNYELETGQIRLSLIAEPGLVLLRKTEPDEALKARPATELKPGDDALLRQAAAMFTLTTAPAGSTVPSQEPAAPADPPRTQTSSLLALLLDTQQGTLVLLLLAAGFGAAHALTPGH